ncbi:tumor necrosis factor receptor superfamily member 1B [Sardina pilchardus]|uniref:tumor necrosis factor receptor superfamily member 1B n=1 Tax=Sardina pilchardus TaxID=27697 RepID=UPI002E121488
MAFQIPCLLFLVVLFFVKTEGSDGSCNNITHIFKEDLNICCKKCEPGFHMKSECSEGKETVCAPCSNGRWSGYNYFKNCFKCTACKKSLEYAQNCSTTRDAKCRCPSGRYCSNGYEEPYCTEHCKAYTPCPPGQGVVTAGTAGANVKCEDCPDGTFSDQSSSTQMCQAYSRCAPGGVLKEGTPTSDTVCKVPMDLVDPSSTTTQRATTQVTTLGPPMPNRAGNITPSTVPHTWSTSTGPQSVISKPSNGTSGTTDLTAPLACCGALLLVVGLLCAVYYFKNRRGPPEKETKVENGCLKVPLPPSPSRPECQLLLNNSDLADPSVSSSAKQTRSGPSTGPHPSPAARASNVYATHDDIRKELPQSPTVHQVVNLNLSIVASAPASAAPLVPAGASTPRPNGRPPEMDSELPLSQEEVDVPPGQTEQGKEAHTAVPETGEFVC